VACGWMVLSKTVPSRLLSLILGWSLVTMLATGAIPNALCRGQAPWTTGLAFQLVIFIAALLEACYLTYRQIERSRREKRADYGADPK
jgi:hypothetical protein